jgi:hypothetical protein
MKNFERIRAKPKFLLTSRPSLKHRLKQDADLGQRMQRAVHAAGFLFVAKVSFGDLDM